MVLSLGIFFETISWEGRMGIEGQDELFSLGNLPAIGGLDTENIRDYAGLISRLGEGYFQNFAPLQQGAASILGDVLSGGGSALRTLASPGIAAIQGQIPHAQRRIEDTVGGANRGLAAEGKIRAEEAGLEQIGNILSSLQQGLGQTALSTGLGVSSTTLPFLLGAADLLVRRKAAQQGGGK